MARLREATNSIIKELELIAQTIYDGQHLTSIYFGGGTPSVLPAPHVEEILNVIKNNFNISSCCELSFEGDAITLSVQGYLEKISDLGFSRISYGIQTLDEGARRVLNLRPTLQQLIYISRKAKTLFEDVNVDFIYGWPGQKASDVNCDLGLLINEIEPRSVEVFKFEAMDASPSLLKEFERRNVRLPSTVELQVQQRTAADILAQHGFFRSSYTKFSKNKYKSVNYDECYYGWNNGQVLAAGRGAQSFYRGVMWGSALSEEHYLEALKIGELPVNTISEFEVDERELVTWPRRGHIDCSLIDRHGEVGSKIAILIDAGLAVLKDNTVQLSDDGTDWVPAILNFLTPTHQAITVAGLTEQRSIKRFIKIAPNE
jgi:oxygen-independent coproporphyrinogen-3 oxidase